MAIYNKEISFTREKIVNLYRRDGSITDTVYGLFRFLGIIVQNVYCVSSYLILTWIILFPISWIRNDLYSKMENYLYNSLLFIVSSWSLAAGAPVIETGEDYKYLIEGLPESRLRKAKELSDIPASSGDYSSTSFDETCSSQKDLKRSGTVDVGFNSEMLEGSSHSIKQRDSHLNDLNESEIDTPTLHQETTHMTDNSRVVENNKRSQLNNVQQLNNGNCSSKKSEVAISDDGMVQNPRILLLCNHISTADVPLVMQSFSTLTKQSLLWVLDAQVSFQRPLMNLNCFLIHPN